MSSFIGPFQESVYKVESVYYSAYDYDIPSLTIEYELVVNGQLEFLAVDSNQTAIRTN